MEEWVTIQKYVRDATENAIQRSGYEKLKIERGTHGKYKTGEILI